MLFDVLLLHGGILAKVHQFLIKHFTERFCSGYNGTSMYRRGQVRFRGQLQSKTRIRKFEWWFPKHPKVIGSANYLIFIGKSYKVPPCSRIQYRNHVFEIRCGKFLYCRFHGRVFILYGQDGNIRRDQLTYYIGMKIITISIGNIKYTHMRYIQLFQI